MKKILKFTTHICLHVFLTTNFKVLADGFLEISQGRVVRKPFNANPGLKVNQQINFSCLKMFFAAYVLGSLRLFKLKTQG